MSDSMKLSEQLSKRAAELRRDVELYEEAVEHIGVLDCLLDNRSENSREMCVALKQIAALAHNGGLIGFSNEHACLNEIRRLSLRWLERWWDMAECSRLEVEQEQGR